MKNQRKLPKLTSTCEDSPYEVLQKKDRAVALRNAAHLRKYETIPEYLLHQPEMDTMNYDDGMSEQAAIGNLNNPSIIETQLCILQIRVLQIHVQILILI